MTMPSLSPVERRIMYRFARTTEITYRCQIFSVTPQDQKRPIYEDIKIDTAFRKISPKAIGFYVWRIQNDHVEAIPREQYGTFYDENTYVIYSASLAGTISDKNTIVSIRSWP